jgi:hypothetical protein
LIEERANVDNLAHYRFMMFLYILFTGLSQSYPLKV